MGKYITVKNDMWICDEYYPEGKLTVEWDRDSIPPDVGDGMILRVNFNPRKIDVDQLPHDLEHLKDRCIAEYGHVDALEHFVKIVNRFSDEWYAAESHTIGYSQGDYVDLAVLASREEFPDRELACRAAEAYGDEYGQWAIGNTVMATFTTNDGDSETVGGFYGEIFSADDDIMADIRSNFGLTLADAYASDWG